MRREIHPELPKNVRAINSCRSYPAVSLAGSRYLLLQGGAGHRAKPVLNALLNFTNLRRAVNHLGGSARVRLLLLSYSAWPSTRRVPSRAMGSADGSTLLLPVVLRITYHPNPDISRFDLFPSHSAVTSFRALLLLSRLTRTPLFPVSPRPLFPSSSPQDCHSLRSTNALPQFHPRNLLFRSAMRSSILVSML